MKKPIMIHVLALFLISTLAGCASCSSDLKENGKENGKEEKPDTEEVRPESFASDDEMLDYIQKVHLNYMWDGAEPTSGLARERIHLDGDYPEKGPECCHHRRQRIWYSRTAGGHRTRLHPQGRRREAPDPRLPIT